MEGGPANKPDADRGQALLGIDMSGDDEVHDAPSNPAAVRRDNEEERNLFDSEPQQEGVADSTTMQGADSSGIEPGNFDSTPGLTSMLATPAVRRLLKEHTVNIADVQGTGKDGRVLEHDVIRYVESQAAASQETLPSSSAPYTDVGDRRVALSPIQSQVFKSMTASLSIPHFIYTHTVDLTHLAELVKNYREDTASASRLTGDTGATIKLTLLPFILKALSQAVSQYPAVNSSLYVDKSPATNDRGC